MEIPRSLKRGWHQENGENKGKLIEIASLALRYMQNFFKLFCLEVVGRRLSLKSGYTEIAGNGDRVWNWKKKKKKRNSLWWLYSLNGRGVTACKFFVRMGALEHDLTQPSWEACMRSKGKEVAQTCCKFTLFLTLRDQAILLLDPPHSQLLIIRRSEPSPSYSQSVRWLTWAWTRYVSLTSGWWRQARDRTLLGTQPSTPWMSSSTGWKGSWDPAATEAAAKWEQDFHGSFRWPRVVDSWGVSTQRLWRLHHETILPETPLCCSPLQN